MWPSGAWFTFNCYRHWAQLILRMHKGNEVSIIFSKEGVTQGDPLSMVVYGIGMIPLTLQLKREILDCFQPWYDEDAAAGENFDKIEEYFIKLTELSLA